MLKVQHPTDYLKKDGQYIAKTKRSSQHKQGQDLQQQRANGPILKHFSGEVFSQRRKRHRRSDSVPQPGSSLQVSERLQNTDYSKANVRLEEFVKYFVKEFEAKLHAYHLIFEGETKKAGKFSDTFSEIVGQGIGGGAGGLVGFFFGSPATGAKLGAKLGVTAGKAVGKQLGSIVGNKVHAKKITKLLDLIDFSLKDKTNLRWLLVEAGFDIFQSFEMQFMRVTTQQGPKKAIQQLAKDATNRAIMYMKENKDKSISESVILGDSKKEAIHSLSPGFEIQYEFHSSKKAWNTASLYEKVGVVIEGRSYYKKKGVKGGTTKYGYRRLLLQESWDKLKNKYDSDNIVESNSGQFADYQYSVSSKDLIKQLRNILDNLNTSDTNLGEDRMNNLIKEVRKDILDEIDVLKKQSHGYIEDRKILAKIEANLKNLKVDEYLEMFKQYFEEAKQERKKIAESIEASREENREIFNKLSQKQNIHHDDNKSEHKKTQKGIERVEGGIEGNSKKIDEIHEVVVAQKIRLPKDPIWFDVENPVVLFTGRVKQLEKLHISLQSKDETAISQTISVSGLGGIGKTEIARKYAYDHANDYDGNVIWINAESYQTLTASFLRLAQDKLGMNVKGVDGNQKDIKTIVDNVYGFFSKRKCLFIFDNAEKLRSQENVDEGIHKFLPSLPSNVNKPYILITSRNQKWGDIKLLTLGTFSEQESIDFIKKALGKKGELQINEIKNLVKILQYFPLALQQAVAYINERDRILMNVGLKFEINDYLKIYDKEVKKILDFKFPDDSSDLYTKTTFTTWKITTDKIKENNEYGKQAGEILDIIAYFAPDGIPVQLFLGSELIDGDKEKLGDVIQLLKQYSMVNSGQEPTVLNVHRLVQKVSRIELEEQGKNEIIIQQAFELLGKTFPYGKDTLKYYSTKRKLLPHLEVFLSHIDNWIAKCPADKQKIEKHYLESLLPWISDGYSSLGDSKKNKDLLERVLEIKVKHYGPDHFKVARTLVNLGNVYGDLGVPQKKKVLLERSLAIIKDYYGPDHIEVARILVNLSNAYGALGDPNKQKNLLDRALAIIGNQNEYDNFEVAVILANLGTVYGALGDPRKQKDLLEHALPILEKHYGPDNIEFATILGNLGSAYGDLSDHKKQKDLLERALAIKEKYYGSDNFAVAITLVNLGNAYGDLGDHQKTKTLLERALPILERHYGYDNFEIAITLVSLGITYGDLGDSQKKKDLLERALAIQEKHYGPNNFQIAITLLNLGNAYGDLGNPKKNKDLLERALAIQEKHYGSDHLKIAKTLVNLGNAYRELGDPKRQKGLLERALAIKEKHYSSDHIEIARTLVNLGNAYGNLGDFQKKMVLNERALSINEKHFGPDSFEVAITLVNLGNAYGALGDPKKQKDLLERALTIDEKLYGPDNFEVAKTLVNLGNAYGDLGEPQKKRDLLERALGIQEKHYGPGHFEVAITLGNLGNAYGVLGDVKKQKDMLEQALKIQEKHYGHDNFEVARTLVNLSTAYEALGDPKKQNDLLERALKIRENYYGPDHIEVAKTLINLGIAYGNLGDFQKKKNLLERALSIFEKHYGYDNFEVARILVNLGAAYGNLDDHQKAYELYEKSSKITEKQTPLHLATRSGNFKTVEFILQKGADILAKNSPYTVLHQAVGSGKEEVIRLIVEKIKEKYPQNIYEHINAKDIEGNTPLMWAAVNGNTNSAKILQEYGADLNVQNNDGETALHWAVKVGNQASVQLLLDSKADPNIQNSHGKTPLNLSQERLAQDLENENWRTITGLLLSASDESKLQRQEEQASGSLSLEDCLPNTRTGRRRKREVARECLFSWEDVDEFNTEKDDIRDFSKINIGSDKFIDYIKELPERKRSQLIQLANTVQVTGQSLNLIHKLTGNQKIISHLNKVGRYSGLTMHGMMAKNVLADFLNGDYQGVAINIGFISGGQGFAKVAQTASIKGLELASEGKLLLGRCLRAASPFLARGTSAFVVYDLINQIKEFKNGTEDALVGMVGDGIYLGVDAAEIGIEVSEALEVLEGVSSVTGPIGTAIGAVVFVGTGIYKAVKRVDKIDQFIHIKGNEKFIEGLRAFIGMQPERYIEELMEEKQVNNQLVKQGLEFLKKHSDIQRYVFPTGKSVIDSCRTVPYQTSVCSGGFNWCSARRTVTRYAENCTTKFEEDLDSTVLLDRKRTDIKWSRARPDNPSAGQLFCLPQGDYLFVPNDESYLCQSAIGVTDLPTNKTGNYTLINLGEGEDYAKGFIDSPNIFIVNNGVKIYHGGNKDDSFILQGDRIKGFLSGSGGINTLDLRVFAPNATNVDVVLDRGDVIFDRYHILQAFGMNKVLGRKDKADRIFSTCDTQFIDGKSGAENNLDVIVIDNNNCTYKMQMTVRPNTIIINRASKGDFYYTVPYAFGSAKIDFSYSSELLNSKNTFFFEYSFADIKNISIENLKVLNKTSKVITFNFSKMLDNEFNITISGAKNPSYILGNSTELIVGNKDNLYMLENTYESVDEIIKSYLVVANRINKMSFFIQSLLSNETVAIGSGNFEVIHNNPLYKSHLVGNGGENVYVICPGGKNLQVSIPEVVIYDLDVGSAVDTIDLRNIVQQAKNLTNNFELHVLKSANDLLLKATVTEVRATEGLSVNKIIIKDYFTVRLKDGVIWYNKTHVIMYNFNLKINRDNNEWSLIPLPLKFEKDKEVIIVTSQDIEENTELITPKRAGNYIFVRDNGGDLMITNAFDTNIAIDDLCTITLSKFYEEPKMETLSIKFADKVIVLKEHREEINKAKYFSYIKKEYTVKVYKEVFESKNMSPEFAMVLDQPVPHRHRHEHHIRNRRSKYTISSGTRLSSWISDLFGWVKSSVGGLFYSGASLPGETSSTASSILQIDVNGTILLLDVLIRKVTGQNYISSTDQHVTLSEVRGYALNITNEFEKLVEQAAKDSKISIHRLNIDFIKVQEDITKKVIGAKFNEISGILTSYIEKACPGREIGCAGRLSSKKFHKFMATFNKMLDLSPLDQMVHKENNVLKITQNLSLTVHKSKLDDELITGNTRELVAGRR